MEPYIVAIIFQSFEFWSFCFCTAVLRFSIYQIWVEVCTSTRLWKHPDSFLFQPFCHTFAIVPVLGIIVVLHAPVLAKLAIGQMASHFTSRILWYTEEFVVDSMIVRSPAASQTKKHPPSTTLTESWFELFVLIHFVWFLRTFQLWSHLSKIYYCRSFVVVFFQMQLCKPKLW